MGSVVAFATCKNCGEPIEKTYWGNGGFLWTHAETDSDFCHPRPPVAVPLPGSEKVVDL